MKRADIPQEFENRAYNAIHAVVSTREQSGSYSGNGDHFTAEIRDAVIMELISFSNEKELEDMYMNGCTL